MSLKLELGGRKYILQCLFEGIRPDTEIGIREHLSFYICRSELQTDTKPLLYLLQYIDKRPYETFEQSDFLPFRAGMGAGAPFVLVSHNVVECMDAALPASLSPAGQEGLREPWGCDGSVSTDDLAMDAVKQYANGEAAVLAVLAGNDMLITSDYQNDIPAVLAAVADGRIAEREIDAHVLRILRYKQAQGWIE